MCQNQMQSSEAKTDITIIRKTGLCEYLIVLMLITMTYSTISTTVLESLHDLDGPHKNNIGHIPFMWMGKVGYNNGQHGDCHYLGIHYTK